MFEAEDFAVVAFFDGVAEKEDVLNVLVFELVDLDGVEFGVKVLSFIAGEQVEEVDACYHGEMFRFLFDECVLVEELDIVNGIFEAFGVARTQSVE